MSSSSHLPSPTRLGDYTTDRGIFRLIGFGACAGLFGVVAGWILLRMIGLINDLVYYGVWSTRMLAAGGAISIGTGGPFGAEGPIIMTGGAAASLMAQCFTLTDAERKTLLVAGACAGMTAVFGTPVAALLLAVELLLFELKPRSIIPVGAACITAAILRRFCMAPAPLFPYAGGVIVDPLHALGWLGVGLAAGFGSALLTMLVYAAEDGFETLPIHWMWWPVLGGLVVGIGGVFDPASLGVGYPDIARLLAGTLAGGAAIRLVLVKGVIWSVAL
ncbi:MAG: chloride channel protein, partial [Acidiphilium sp. 37-67-22]